MPDVLNDRRLIELELSRRPSFRDFLPRIVDEQVLQVLKTDGRYDRSKLKFYHWRNDPFLPVEFSVAADRLGHSMVRPERQCPAANLPEFEG